MERFSWTFQALRTGRISPLVANRADDRCMSPGSGCPNIHYSGAYPGGSYPLLRLMESSARAPGGMLRFVRKFRADGRLRDVQ